MNERAMKPSESSVVDVECNGRTVKEIKKIVYRGLSIYAVKRSTDFSDTECALLDRTNVAWWCGYVEVPVDMHNLFKPKGYLDEAILDELDDPNKYNLASAHGGYTYIDYGIPLVLDNNQEVFLGWDYNHFYDEGTCVTYNDIIDEGKRVVDSMLDENRRKSNA